MFPKVGQDQPTTSEQHNVCINNKKSALTNNHLPGKKGVAFLLGGKDGRDVQNLPKVQMLHPYWNYSWGTKRIEAQPDDVEFVPMIWMGNDAERLQKILKADVEEPSTRGQVRFLLGFNEPDEKTQSNMKVEVALERWPILESNCRNNVTLVSPSCAHPLGDWMKAFMKNVDDTGKQVDWVGVHWYGGANFKGFAAKMREFHQAYRRPIIITEFAPADWGAKSVADNKFTPAQVLAFMKQALPWMEAQDWIVGYAWFSFGITQKQGTSSALFDAHGHLTTCGRYYASVSKSNPKGDQRIVA